MRYAARGHIALGRFYNFPSELGAKFFVAMTGEVGAQIFFRLAIAQVGPQQPLDRLRHSGAGQRYPTGRATPEWWPTAPPTQK